jgi:hypothetical protein
MMTKQVHNQPISNTISAEMSLCLACCEAALNNEKNGAVEYCLEEHIDWTLLVETALWHHVGPSVFGILLDEHAGRLPGVAFAQIKLEHERHRLQSGAISGELGRIAQAFHNAGIAMLPFKGPLLAQQLYGDAQARSCGDLDLLVGDADIQVSLDILQTLGYPYQTVRTPAQEQAFCECAGQHQIVRQDGEFIVELHWRVAQSLAAVPLDYQSLWSDAYQSNFQNAPVWSLHSEDLPIVLCVHGGKEHWVRLKWVCDIAHFISQQTDEFNWKSVFDKSTSQGCERMLLVGIGLANRLMDVDIPDTARCRLGKDRIAGNLVAKIANQLMYTMNPTPSIWSLTKFRFQVRERLRDRSYYVVRTLFTPRAIHFEMLKLPDALFFVYYVVRVGHDYVLVPIWTVYKALRVKLKNW